MYEALSYMHLRVQRFLFFSFLLLFPYAHSHEQRAARRCRHVLRNISPDSTCFFFQALVRPYMLLVYETLSY